MTIYQRHGQPDYVEVIAFDAIDAAGCNPLDGVSAGFVHGLAGGNVGGNFRVAELDEVDAGGSAVDYFLRIAAQADAGDHFVVAAREETEHAQRVGVVARFFEDVLVDYYDGVAG